MLLDPLAFSGLVAASVAGLLVELHARLLAPGLGAGDRLTLVGLAACGTFVVYGLDRLRDIEADRGAWPERTAFVERHPREMWASVGLAGAAAAACAWQQPFAVWAICAGVGAMGFAHRRLKTRARFKVAYLTLAWWLVTVAMPAVHATALPSLWPLAAIATSTALALLANLVGSNAFETGGDEKRRTALETGGGNRRRTAIAIAGAGVAAALVGGPNVAPLAFVPAAQAVGLWPRHAGERARLWRIDGALAVGATLALGALSRA